MLTVLDLQTIASYGGGMIIDAKSIPINDLTSIASYASNKQAQIIIKNASIIPPIELQSIASFSKGCVIFDFCG